MDSTQSATRWALYALAVAGVLLAGRWSQRKAAH